MMPSVSLPQYKHTYRSKNSGYTFTAELATHEDCLVVGQIGIERSRDCYSGRILRSEIGVARPSSCVTVSMSLPGADAAHAHQSSNLEKCAILELRLNSLDKALGTQWSN